MSSKLFASLALVGAASLSLGLNASAGTSGVGASQEPGSLLIYPIFDNTRGGMTVISVTNTNDDTTPVTGGLAGTVNVEFVYIHKDDCFEFNRTRTLTPNDTLSVVAKLDNPNMDKGYVYVFAKSKTTGKAIKWDYLVGSELLVNAGNPDISSELTAFVYKAGSALAHGANTDLENGVGDGIRDLNGLEYELSPDQILIPRFFGQEDGESHGSLVLIGLTGGEQFRTIVDFLVYNDNEEVFSAQYDFDCWKRVDLLDISALFHNDFLESTGHTASESVDGIESGWMRIDGNLAYSTNTSIADPAFLAVLLCDQFTDDSVGALPFTLGSQDNGDLLPQGILGDPVQ